MQLPSRLPIFVSLLVAAACSDREQSPTAIPAPPAPPAPIIEPAQGMWIATSIPRALVRFSPSQLRISGLQSAATTVRTQSSTLAGINSVAFDRNGTLWIASEDDSVLLAFPPVALTADGRQDASVVIRSVNGSLSAPSAIAFDTQHRLWVANPNNHSLVRYDVAQLSASGSPEPSVVISDVGSPSGIAFDANGALWVADSRANRINRFEAAQLERSGSPVPQAIVRGADHTLVGPTGLAFDVSGTLWVSNIVNGTVISFTRRQLATAGVLAPDVVLTLQPRVNLIPTGLAFDDDGSLWVVDVNGTLQKFAPASLVTSGSPAPAVNLSIGHPGLLWSVAFWPRPTALPLF